MDFNTIKILHLDSNHPYLWDTLESLGFSNTADFTSSKAEIMARMPEYHGIIIRSRFPIDKAFIDSATQLQFIARVGAGLESIDCDYAQEKNITLIAAPRGEQQCRGRTRFGDATQLVQQLESGQCAHTPRSVATRRKPGL